MKRDYDLFARKCFAWAMAKIEMDYDGLPGHVFHAVPAFTCWSGHGRTLARLWSETWADRFFGSEWSEEIMPIAVECGLAERATWDGSGEPPCDEIEQGGEYWRWMPEKP